MSPKLVEIKQNFIFNAAQNDGSSRGKFLNFAEDFGISASLSLLAEELADTSIMEEIEEEDWCRIVYIVRPIIEELWLSKLLEGSTEKLLH